MDKKVLFLVNHDLVVYNFRKELVEALLREGYEVIISSPYGERIDKLIEMGCSYEEIEINRHGTNPLADLKLMIQYQKLIKRVEPDVVLTFTIKPNIYGGFVSRINRIPYIANITGLGTAVENPGILQRITLFMYRIAFKRINTIFFQNQENMDFFKSKKLYNDKHKLIPGSGVNLEEFTVLDYPDTDSIEFVFISRIMKEKGIDQYIEAAKFIRDKYPMTKFHICGFCEDDYETTLDDLTKNGIVEYHGMVSNIKTILKRTHCTIHPSYYPEGISNVLLESAASGRPLITTNRSGCREVVDNGISGYIVAARDTNDLIKAIEKFISLDMIQMRDMGFSGREKVKKEFDRKIVVNNYMKKIRKALGY